MSKSEPGVHIMSPPILEAEEIPYDRADMGPGVLIWRLSSTARRSIG